MNIVSALLKWWKSTIRTVLMCAVFIIYWSASYKLSYSIFTSIFILFSLFEINASGTVGICSNLPVRSAVAFGKPRIFVTVTMSLPLIGRKHKDTQSSPRSPASILKLKGIKIWVCEIHINCLRNNFRLITLRMKKCKESEGQLIGFAKGQRRDIQ